MHFRSLMHLFEIGFKWFHVVNIWVRKGQQVLTNRIEVCFHLLNSLWCKSKWTHKSIENVLPTFFRKFYCFALLPNLYSKNGQKRILPKFQRIEFFSIFKIWWYGLRLVKTHPLELFWTSYHVSKHHIPKTPRRFCRLMKSATFRGLL